MKCKGDILKKEWQRKMTEKQGEVAEADQAGERRERPNFLWTDALQINPRSQEWNYASLLWKYEWQLFMLHTYDIRLA